MLPARVGLRAVPRTAGRLGASPSSSSAPASLLIRRAAASTTTTTPASTSTTSSPSSPSGPIPVDALSPLIAQRLRRPVAPHLTIYKLEQTWFGASALNRIAGCALSGGLYLYAGAYVLAPLAGWHLESMSLAAAAAALPFAAKAALKTAVGGTFVFHLLNGLRHLSWDVAVGFSKPHIWRSTWAIWGLTAVGGLYLGLAV
jgi:succinate dehydrogenase (ubiquinone) cytochrome b560 subunit